MSNIPNFRYKLYSTTNDTDTHPLTQFRDKYNFNYSCFYGDVAAEQIVVYLYLFKDLANKPNGYPYQSVPQQELSLDNTLDYGYTYKQIIYSDKKVIVGLDTYYTFKFDMNNIVKNAFKLIDCDMNNDWGSYDIRMQYNQPYIYYRMVIEYDDINNNNNTHQIWTMNDHFMDVSTVLLPAEVSTGNISDYNSILNTNIYEDYSYYDESQGMTLTSRMVRDQIYPCRVDYEIQPFQIVPFNLFDKLVDIENNNSFNERSTYTLSFLDWAMNYKYDDHTVYTEIPTWQPDDVYNTNRLYFKVKDCWEKPVVTYIDRYGNLRQILFDSFTKNRQVESSTIVQDFNENRIYNNDINDTYTLHLLHYDFDENVLKDLIASPKWWLQVEPIIDYMCFEFMPVELQTKNIDINYTNRDNIQFDFKRLTETRSF